MDQVIIINGADILVELIALISLVAGYFAKGVLFSILSELAYRPTAHWIIAKGEEWQHSHPDRLDFIMHFIENHKGIRPTACNHHRCSRLA